CSHAAMTPVTTSTPADVSATGENAFTKSAAAAPRVPSSCARHAGMATTATPNSVPNHEPAARMWSASADTASARRCVAAACPLNANDSASTNAAASATRQRAAPALSAATIAMMQAATSNSHAHPHTVVVTIAVTSTGIGGLPRSAATCAASRNAASIRSSAVANRNTTSALASTRRASSGRPAAARGVTQRASTIDPTNASIATKLTHRTITYSGDSTSKPPASVVSIDIAGLACETLSGSVAGGAFVGAAIALAAMVKVKLPCTGWPSSDVVRHRTVYVPGASEPSSG